MSRLHDFLHLTTAQEMLIDLSDFIDVRDHLTEHDIPKDLTFDEVVQTMITAISRKIQETI